MAFGHLFRKESWTQITIVTICESHLLPAILKTARSTTSNKIVADTVVAGILMMLSVDSIEAVVDIWRNLGMIQCRT